MSGFFQVLWRKTLKTTLRCKWILSFACRAVCVFLDVCADFFLTCIFCPVSNSSFIPLNKLQSSQALPLSWALLPLVVEVCLTYRTGTLMNIYGFCFHLSSRWVKQSEKGVTKAFPQGQVQPYWIILLGFLY